MSLLRPGAATRPPLPLVVALALAALVAALLRVPAAGAAPPPGTRWVRPVDGPVVEPFRAPRDRFSAGHRGADLGAVAGTPVRAAGAGVVTFAGPVAGTLHVVVAHDGGLRTGYSFLSELRVATGDRVRAGDVVGSTGGEAGDAHRRGPLHLSLRAGDEYLDPMVLFRPVDLARVVALAPEGRDPVAPLVVAPEQEARDLRSLLAVVVPSAGAVRALAEASGGLSTHGCTGDPPAADGTGGSGHALMAVAGIGSSWDGDGNALGLPAASLGYDPAEVHSFSYDGDGAYTPSSTWDALSAAGARLADQLRALQRAQPGREVDLVAHSQGGVVVDAFLQLHYRPGDPTLPPIGTVVTLSSPHRGAPLASASRAVDGSTAGLAVHGAASGVAGVPPPGAAALRDLAEGSDLLRRVWARRLPDHVDFTSLGAPDDVVVPAGSTRVPDAGATNAVVDPSGVVGEHGAMVDDPTVMRAVRLALEGRPPPCTSLVLRARAALESFVVTRAERGAGFLAGVAGRVVDALVP